MIGGSAVLGPVLGGVLVDADLLGTGWRAVFLVNVPLGIAALVAGLRLLPESRAERPADARPRRRRARDARRRAADLPADPGPRGGLAGVDLRRRWPRARSRSARSSSLERRRERAGVSPLVTPSLFRKRAFSAGLVTALVFFAGMIGLMLTFTLYLQLGLGFCAIDAGLAMVPWSLGTAIGAGIGAGLLGAAVRPADAARRRRGDARRRARDARRRRRRAGDELSLWALAGPELVAGVGMGAMLAPLFDFVLAGVDDDEIGSASGVLNAMQQLGGAAGIAVLGTVFFSVGGAHGLGVAFERVLWIEAGVLVVVAALICLLPMRAREDAVHA